MRKAIIKMCNVLSNVVLVVVVAICIALIVPRFANFEIFTVLSGSMEPTYHVGSVVYINKNVKADAIKVKDPIAFHLENGEIATHRVVKVDKENQQFVTKGDANNAEDIKPIPFKQLIGKAVFTIPLIGYISANIRTTKGIIACTICVIIVILLYALPAILDEKEDDEDASAK
ncbi:signal peptidase, endoplasmic reticulum-type [Lachnospiraceae bacterium XBB1006]|nr:signal peptidase, endoplasmic reticulum-type [Lachnospiraceae bacterium XBB1006]